MRELMEPGAGLDMCAPLAGTWNAAVLGLEREATAADVLAVTAAENIVLGEELRWLDLDGGEP